jgi:curved DNA-binding protein CbpA
MLVDHFAILGLPPSASPEEIKIAYRKLARTSHPDLHPTDTQAVDRFRSIQLAYETLSRPRLRTAYMEKRWYAQYRNQPLETKPLDLFRILQKCIELERFVSTLDPYRMDHQGLREHIHRSLEEWNKIEWKVDTEKDPAQQISRLLIESCRHLSYDDSHSIHLKIKSWFDHNRSGHLLHDKWLADRKRTENWQRCWPVWMGLITLVLAVIIWLSAR